MSKGAVNKGRVVLKVVFLDRSPFAEIRQQESFQYFTQDNFASSRGDNCESVPYPINGVRISDYKKGYNNYIEDDSGYGPDDGYTDVTSTVPSDDGYDVSVTTQEPYDKSAKERIEQEKFDEKAYRADAAGIAARDEALKAWDAANPGLSNTVAAREIAGKEAYDKAYQEAFNK